MTMEAQVEALAELEKGDEVEEQFRKLERETEIEAELKAIKDKMKT